MDATEPYSFTHPLEDVVLTHPPLDEFSGGCEAIAYHRQFHATYDLPCSYLDLFYGRDARRLDEEIRAYLISLEPAFHDVEAPLVTEPLSRLVSFFQVVRDRSHRRHGVSTINQSHRKGAPSHGRKSRYNHRH